MPLARWVWDRPRVLEAVLTLLGNILFPRVSYRLRWRTRLGPRGTALYTLAWTAFAVAFMWTVRRLARIQEETRAEVRAHLGRDPTPDEVFEYLQAKER
jgi:hypothetical protein